MTTRWVLLSFLSCYASGLNITCPRGSFSLGVVLYTQHETFTREALAGDITNFLVCAFCSNSSEPIQPRPTWFESCHNGGVLNATSHYRYRGYFDDCIASQKSRINRFMSLCTRDNFGDPTEQDFDTKCLRGPARGFAFEPRPNVSAVLSTIKHLANEEEETENPWTNYFDTAELQCPRGNKILGSYHFRTYSSYANPLKFSLNGWRSFLCVSCTESSMICRQRTLKHLGKTQFVYKCLQGDCDGNCMNATNNPVGDFCGFDGQAKELKPCGSGLGSSSPEALTTMGPVSLWQCITGLSLLTCLGLIASVFVLVSRLGAKELEQREETVKPAFTVPIPDGTYETVHDYDEYYTKKN